MTAPQRIQLRRTKGWRKPPGAVVVARPSKWGNPYRIVRGPRGFTVRSDDSVIGTFDTVDAAFGMGAAHWAVQAYKLHLGRNPELRAAIRAELAGRDLACWCPPGQECHADVLLDIANRP